MAVGTIPNTALVKGMVEMDEKGYIVADETCVCGHVLPAGSYLTDYEV